MDLKDYVCISKGQAKFLVDALNDFIEDLHDKIERSHKRRDELMERGDRLEACYEESVCEGIEEGYKALRFLERVMPGEIKEATYDNDNKD